MKKQVVTYFFDNMREAIDFARKRLNCVLSAAMNEVALGQLTELV